MRTLGFLLLSALLIMEIYFFAEKESALSKKVFGVRLVGAAVALLLVGWPIWGSILATVGYGVVAAVIHLILADDADNTKSPVKPSAPQSKTGYFEYNTLMLTGGDAEFSKCTYRDGTVYYDYGYKIGVHPIGYYQKEDGENPNEYVVLSLSDKEIGVVNDDIISFSRLGMYNSWKEYEEKKRQDHSEEAKRDFISRYYPDPSVKIVAETGTGIIKDWKTGALIATYTGDSIGAAAAFVALSYEVHSQTRYHQFWAEYADRLK